jgi:hypothetical protein
MMKTTMFPEYGFEETFNGEPITGLQEMNGKIYVFTANHVYVARKTKWYQSLWHRIVRLGLSFKGRIWPCHG